jgi:hypothetical protein
MALLPAKWLLRGALPTPSVARFFGLCLRNPKWGVVPGTISHCRRGKDLEFDTPDSATA